MGIGFLISADLISVPPPNISSFYRPPFYRTGTTEKASGVQGEGRFFEKGGDPKTAVQFSSRMTMIWAVIVTE